MLSVILPRTDEPKVIQFTAECIQRELSVIRGAELLLVDSWEQGVKMAKNNYVSLVEPDCTISGGYYASNIGLFEKNSHFRKLAMVSSCLGVRNWGNRIYNYHVDMEPFDDKDESVQIRQYQVYPNREKVSTQLYPVQIGFVPGAVIRTGSLLGIMPKVKFSKDLVKLSSDISFAFWASGRRVHSNPNTTYVSNAEGLENPKPFKIDTYGATVKASILFMSEGI